MKKIAFLLVTLMILSCVSGCGTGAAKEDIDALQQQVSQLQEEYASLRQQASDLREENTALQEQAADLEEENAALQEQAEDLRKENTELQEQLEALQKSLDEKASAAEEEDEETSKPAGEDASDAEVFDTSETEIRGGTNQDDAMQLPLNTKVYGTLKDAESMYLSFHTGPNAGSIYQITVVNKSPIDGRIGFYVLDKWGTELGSESAYADGIASTVAVEGLSPDTDYDIRLVVQNTGNGGTRKETAHFALIIRDINTQEEGINTTNNLINAITPPDDIDSLVVGTNQDDSALIPFDKTVTGELKDALGGWFAFATVDLAESVYQISTVNKSTNDSLRIGVYVIDELGTEIAAEYAYSNGVTKTITLDSLQPNTVYYIRLIVQNTGNRGTRKDTAGYALTVHCESTAPEANTATVEEAKEVVLKTPFELSSTQVRFKANQAVFIDENEAKEALAPVAEIILAHPGYPILLAGTTAQFGTQESCVALSERRTEAVKNLLVNDFGVPESQLITKGLGYADDPFVRGRDVDADGNFIESEGAKNRRVVVLNAESETAKQILGNQ